MPAFRPVTRLSLSCAALTLAAASAAQDAPIVQPGAPGEAARTISAKEAARLADTRFSPADVAFMQAMVHHHHQALVMAEFAEQHSQSREVRETAARIETTQEDEIGFMRGWLAERGQVVPDPALVTAHVGHGMGAMHTMPGMLTAEQLAELGELRAMPFDRRFLELMIAHHAGAVTMVETLLEQPGTAHDPAMYDFVNDVVNDQTAEIARMNIQLAGLSDDPRANLAAGFRDAGEAAWNMTLLANKPNPAGFFDPANPAGLQPEKPVEDGAEAKPAANGDKPERQFADRNPLLSFGNTDLAFAGDILVAGNYHGFNIYRLDDAGMPLLASSTVCPGGQGDVSVVGDLLLMSVEQTRGRVDCGTQGIAEDVSPDRFRGLRIFDISDRSRPRQVGQVQTCRGSHTHSVVEFPTQQRNSIIVYNSGTSGVRAEEELAGCVGNIPGDTRTALFSIDVIEIPVADPGAATIIDRPRIFADDSGNLAGLWRGGDHGDGTQDTNQTNQCHDITVFPSLNLAAGACSGNGIILDIADARAPKRIDAVVDEGFAYWHSATFNNDGTKVLFTDEWGGGAQPRCQASDRRDWGANAIYDIEGGKLERRGTYKLPAPQGKMENCVAHNGSIVPVPGRDIMVQAWYQGGLSVFDFTDSNNPVEIAFFDRGPIDEEQRLVGGYWSAYFYKGRIYATEIVRGLDVLELQPSASLSANEIAAAALAQGEAAFNPQRQTPVTWAPHPVVALAYLDQLERTNALMPGQVADLRTILERLRDGAAVSPSELANAAQTVEMVNAPDGDGDRLAALREVLAGLSQRGG